MQRLNIFSLDRSGMDVHDSCERREGRKAADYVDSTVQEQKVLRKSFKFYSVSSYFQCFSCPLINKQRTEK